MVKICIAIIVLFILTVGNFGFEVLMTHAQTDEKDLSELIEAIGAGKKTLDQILKEMDDDEVVALIRLAYDKKYYRQNKPLIDEILGQFVATTNLPQPYVKSFQALFETLPEDKQETFLCKAALQAKHYEDATIEEIKGTSYYFFHELDYRKKKVQMNIRTILDYYLESTGIFDSKLTGTIIPENYHNIFKDILAFFILHLNQERRALKFTEQILFVPENKEKERGERLLNLIKDLPTIQKIGQILARNPNIPEIHRSALQELEDNLKRSYTDDYIPRIVTELTKSGAKVENIDPDTSKAVEYFSVTPKTGKSLRLEIAKKPLAAGTVAEVVPFVLHDGETTSRGIFKVLKPGIIEAIDEEFLIVKDMLVYFEEKMKEYGIGQQDKDFDIEDLIAGKVDGSRLIQAVIGVADIKKLFHEAATFIKDEVAVSKEQSNFKDAYLFFKAAEHTTVPRLFCPELCSDRLTAMEFASGIKISKVGGPSTGGISEEEERRHRAKRLIESFLVSALFMEEKATGKTIFHGDPHAGNIIFNPTKDQLTFLDWGLMDRLDRTQRRSFLLLYLSVMFDNRELLLETIRKLSSNWSSRFANQEELETFTKNLFGTYDFLTRESEMKNDIPLIAAATLLLALRDGITLPKELSLFAKSLFTLDNVLKDLSPGILHSKQIMVIIATNTIRNYPDLLTTSIKLGFRKYIRDKELPMPSDIEQKLTENFQN